MNSAERIQVVFRRVDSDAAAGQGYTACETGEEPGEIVLGDPETLIKPDAMTFANRYVAVLVQFFETLPSPGEKATFGRLLVEWLPENEYRYAAIILIALLGIGKLREGLAKLSNWVSFGDEYKATFLVLSQVLRYNPDFLQSDDLIVIRETITAVRNRIDHLEDRSPRYRYTTQGILDTLSIIEAQINELPFYRLRQELIDIGHSVEDARNTLEDQGMKNAASEFDEALRDLRRHEPDVTGAIQHAYAGLESAAREAAEDSTLTLGGLMKKCPENLEIPRPIAEVVSKVWGYSSEVARHMREGQGRPTPDEARLLVAIAASVATYLARRMSSR